MEENSYVYKQDHSFNNIQENIELVIYSMICFFAPFFIGHPQLIVGVIVNAALILAALNLKGYKLLSVIMMPSLGVLSRGIIFGPYTSLLIFMIPVIWTANAILVFAFKQLFFNNKLNKWLILPIASVLKTGFLFCSAFVLIQFSIIPTVFLSTMGLFQLWTALIGGTIAFGIHHTKKKMQC